MQTESGRAKRTSDKNIRAKARQASLDAAKLRAGEHGREPKANGVRTTSDTRGSTSYLIGEHVLATCEPIRAERIAAKPQ